MITLHVITISGAQLFCIVLPDVLPFGGLRMSSEKGHFQFLALLLPDSVQIRKKQKIRGQSFKTQNTVKLQKKGLFCHKLDSFLMGIIIKSVINALA